jgi:hypothetical protein
MLIRKKANGVCVIQEDTSINLLGVLKIIGCFVVIIYTGSFFLVAAPIGWLFLLVKEYIAAHTEVM